MITYEYKTFIDKQQRTYLKEVRKLEIKKNLVTPKEVNDFFCDQYHIQENAEEYLYIVAVNAAMQPIGVFEIPPIFEIHKKYGRKEREKFLLGGVYFWSNWPEVYFFYADKCCL